ncbi:SigE family RNA polymerase sigma factor [Nonomuraea sp. ATR24]|uniref:SigE family RNA polymerase sigma factor n=1 Tax=Nonomuraea sp. ATR24 TaxID=1676744 RepID=UPI0035C1AC10
MDEESKFAEFVARRGDALMRYGYVLTGNPHDAADLVQEALLKMRAAWPGLRSKDNPESYARTTMARLHIAAWRLRRREQVMWQALAGLPRKQRAVLVLRYYEQLSDAEIAETLGVSRVTVRSQAHRALTKLRATVPAHLIPGGAR